MGGRSIPPDDVDYEVITTDARTVRVYDRNRGDFLLELPANARATFGYFNPAASGESRDKWGNARSGPGSQTTTALRIYEGKDQIAAFLGVDGFRDMRLGLTRLSQKTTVEHNFEDDGRGNTESRKKAQRALVAASEDLDEPAF